MTIEMIPIQSLWKFLTWLPSALLKRKFKPEILANLIHTDLRPRFDPATLDLGSSANFELWLQFINLSPFEVELDRAEFRLRCGPVLKATILKRQKLMSGEITFIRLYDAMTEGQAREIKTSLGNLSVSLEGHIDFNCDLHAFSKNIGQLDGIKPRIINAN